MESPNQPSNFQQPPQLVQQTIVVTGQNKKSMVAAFLLAFFFGPLGLFYSSITGGFIMLLVDIPVFFFTFGLGMFFTNIICVIWAMIAVSNHNNKAAIPRQIQHIQSPISIQTSPPTLPAHQQHQHEPGTPLSQPFKVLDSTVKQADNNVGDWVTQNKKALSIIIGLLAVVVLGLFALRATFSMLISKGVEEVRSAYNSKKEMKELAPTSLATPQKNDSAASENAAMPATPILKGYVRTEQGSDLRLRAEPSETASIIMNIRNYGSVDILGYDNKEVILNGEKGRWCKVRYQEKEGWAWGAFIVRK